MCRVKDEERRAVLLDVEDDGEQHTLIFRFGPRCWNEDRFAGIEAVLEPPRHGARVEIDLDDRVEKIALGLDACAPDITISFAGVRLVIDARQLDRGRGEGLARYL